MRTKQELFGRKKVNPSPGVTQTFPLASARPAAKLNADNQQ
jgi:hypothetical protein